MKLNLDYKTYRKYNYHTKTSVEYLNLESGFDIETTSTLVNNDKFAFMYLWGFGIGENADFFVYGRTWEEFQELINFISNELNLSPERRLVVYIHNLGYEFQFMRKYFEWLEVFAIDERKPIKATIIQGIEFRDSYVLSGYSLENTAKNLHTHTVRKLKGDLDYSKIRHSETTITDQELKYLENDILIILYYINEQLKTSEKITKIPMTNTGRVREYVKNNCYYDKGKSGYKSSKSKSRNYRYIMENLTLTEDEYSKLKWCFMGGYTHSNAYYTNKIINDVHSVDFTSSYPSVMVAEKYPMGSGFKPTKEDILKNGYDYYLDKFCCMVGIGFRNLENKFLNDSYLSDSKCKIRGDKLITNGRVFSAEYLTTFITDVDYWVIKNCYEWEHMEIFDLTCYPTNYLPKPIVESVLQLYQDKTVLKDVKGKEVEYLLSKGMLNSIYGMTVTDIIRDNILYDEDWAIEVVDKTDEIEKYNKKKSRFLFYPWGVWVTAYARRNLWTGIFAMGEDYIYSDTDSVKFKNYEKHKPYLERYNEMTEQKLIQALKYHKLNPELLYPKTQDGEMKLLGVWDYEGYYSRFKTLGAKRYLVEENNELILTVAGLSKKNGINYMLNKSNSDHTKVFKMFDDHLKIPKEETGKNTHTYIDLEKEYTIIDYQGNIKIVKSLSSIHLEETEFNLSISDFYIKFYTMLQQGQVWKGVI